MKKHQYLLDLAWTGNLGQGTANYRAYSRDHQVGASGKPSLLASSDPAFRGDPTRYNPEELLVASLAGCHLLWYLHLCAEAGVVVTSYHDQPSGTMTENPDGSGQFTEVWLRPQVVVAEAQMVEPALALHTQAHKLCFIARSCNFPVRHVPTCTAAV
jgi:organic hydroperoxide reductase OsmC/OhrA